MSAAEVILVVVASVVLGGGIMFGGWVLVTEARRLGEDTSMRPEAVICVVCGIGMVGIGGYLVLSGLLRAVTA